MGRASVNCCDVYAASRRNRIAAAMAWVAFCASQIVGGRCLCLGQEQVVSGGIRNPVTVAVWDENRKQIVVARDSELQCIDPDALEARHTWQMNIEKITHLDISKSGDRLLVAGGDPGHRGRTTSLSWPLSLEAQAIDLDSQSPSAESAEIVMCARWLSDASGWVEADWEGKVCARDSLGRERLRFQGHTGPILAMCLLERDSIVATAGVDASIKFWELTQGRLIASLDNHTDRVFGLAPFSHEDRPATAANAYPPFVSVSTDHTVRLWNWKVGRLVRFARLATEPRLVAWSPTRLQVAVALEDHTLVHVDMETLKVTLLADEPRDRVEAMLIVPNTGTSPDSDRLIVWRTSGATSINLSPASRD